VDKCKPLLAGIHVTEVPKVTEAAGSDQSREGDAPACRCNIQAFARSPVLTRAQAPVVLPIVQT